MKCVAIDVDVVHNSGMATKRHSRTRDQVSARVDPEVLELVERVAQFERRPVSNLVRNILTDWAARVTADTGQRAA
jgi:uncharacterized protein (DUF1778 family)